MKMIILSQLLSLSAFALDCPHLKLSCELSKLNDQGYFVLIDQKAVSFEGFNDDEPSLAANECRAQISFARPRLQAGTTLNFIANANDAGELFLYLYNQKTYGALDPQLKLQYSEGKEYEISYQREKMICRLVP